MAAEMIELEQRRRGRPSMAVNDVLRGAVRIQREELESRRVEAMNLVESLLPHLRRLEMVAHEVGPTAMHSVAAVDSALRRYKRQWEQEGPRAA